MERISFTKMHGIGNDYIYIDCLHACPDRLPDLSREMSPRHTSVGSDGIILILPSEIADFRMRIFNADGSEAKMCGNGSRCVAKYVYDHRLTTKKDITLETLSGVKHLFMTVDEASDTVTEVTVDMGEPILNCKEVPVKFDGTEMIARKVDTPFGTVNLTAISMGNPHGVVFLDTDIDDLDIEPIGRVLECHPIWPDRANIEFVNVTDPHNLRMRVWERGSGETMACGTGACATAVAAIINHLTDMEVTVHLRGGDLRISLDPQSGHVLMTGPATEVYTGTYIRK